MLGDECSSHFIASAGCHDETYKFWAPLFSYDLEVLGSYLLCNGPLEKVKCK